MAANYAQGLSDLGGAVSDLFGAMGSRSAAGSYGEAATIAEQNAAIAKESTVIKETQLQRQIYQTIGAQKSDIAGAGLAESGSALDLLRSSASQGALSKAIAGEQGQITVNAYNEQAQQFQAMQNAANATSTAQTIGGVLQLGSAAYSMFGGSAAAAGGGSSASEIAAAALVSG
jgi:hypothetical protein